MKLRSHRLSWVLVPALALGLVALSSGVATASVGAKKLKSATLEASGSTLQLAFEQSAIDQFTRAQPNVTINYGGGGSGTGRTDLANQVKDFAGSDSPYSAADLANVNGGDVLYFPIVLAPVTIAYNLSGVPKLRLSGPTISKIFQRQVTKWNDRAIKADNPRVKLPSTEILVARRAESSGTTQNFALFLTKSDPTGWKLGTGNPPPTWPSDTQGGQGNSGVAQIVKSTDGAIGYVDYSDARATGLKFALVKNQLGKYVSPNLKAASEAAATVALNTNLTYDPIYATGPGSYPITAPTWIIVYKNQADPAKAAALKAYLTFILTKGQKLAPTVDFAPLPTSLAKQALTQVKQIQG